MLVRADFIAIEWSGWAGSWRSGLGSSPCRTRRVYTGCGAACLAVIR